MTIIVTINGGNQTLPPHTTLAQVIERFAAGPDVVVAVNDCFVPRSHHGAHRLDAGDRVELLAPMEGG